MLVGDLNPTKTIGLQHAYSILGLGLGTVYNLLIS